MTRTIALIWLLACVGFGVILWLLTSAPDISSGFPRSECYSVLGNDWGTSHGSMDERAESACASKQSQRMGWALLVAVPTAALGSAGTRRRSA
ncbi:hypothetical protein [Streptomyces sp. NBC_00102]|uniref:hypothetical protein n=1 Tax=Streptomyces sp. NBC_00102 TaxID=2975652 RepID=UPI002256CDA8|nr:hypothetical protein [Streptomyces sp. NBC_00102]MCX5398429.1 hypothetical protein [Streptomyces sp. NBC_00102]